jgi:hypothetical protein
MLHILYRSLKYLISSGQNGTQILKMIKLQKGAEVQAGVEVQGGAEVQGDLEVQCLLAVLSRVLTTTRRRTTTMSLVDRDARGEKTAAANSDNIVMHPCIKCRKPSFFLHFRQTVLEFLQQIPR